MGRLRPLLTLIVCTIVVFAPVGLSHAGPATPGSPPRGRFVAGEMVVKLRPGASTGAPDRYNGLQVLGWIPGTQWVRVAVRLGQEAASIAAAHARSDVEDATPNYLAEATLIPNDPYYRQQWGLRLINAPLAWDGTTGSANVTIAVLDTGMDFSHPDLAGKAWINAGETPGNGIDDDLNGYTDDYQGWSFVSGGPSAQDDHGHGTHVSGIAAARSDNGVGVAGMTPQSTVMVLKVLDRSGNGTYFDIAAAIRYAADNGARIINMSLAGEEDGGALLQEAVDYAHDKGLLLVAAAGNFATSGGSVPNPVMYPASLPHVVSVAASDQSDNPTSFSEHNQFVDLAAPGVTIWSTARGGGYTVMNGTSMATSFVSGLSALVWTVRPDWSNAEVEAHLSATAAKLGPYPYVGGRNDYFGAGRIDAAAAVWRADPPTLKAAPGAGVAVAADDAVTRTIRITSNSTLPVRVSTAVSPPASWLQVSPTGPMTVTLSQPITLTLVISPQGMPLGPLGTHLQFLADNPYALVIPADVPVRVTHASEVHRVYLRIAKNGPNP